jgi:50S ribosomal subunit-associated GTPase HflX
MGGVINYLLDLVRIPADVIVLGPDDSAELRKAAWYERLIYFIPSSVKFFVYDAGLRWVIDKVEVLERGLSSKNLNSPEYLTLFNKIDSIKNYLEQDVKPDPTKFSSNTVQRVKALAALILADKLEADVARIMDELVQAFASKNNEALFKCIEDMKSLIDKNPFSKNPVPRINISPSPSLQLRGK